MPLKLLASFGGLMLLAIIVVGALSVSSKEAKATQQQQSPLGQTAEPSAASSTNDALLREQFTQLRTSVNDALKDSGIPDGKFEEITEGHDVNPGDLAVIAVTNWAPGRYSTTKIFVGLNAEEVKVCHPDFGGCPPFGVLAWRYDNPGEMFSGGCVTLQRWRVQGTPGNYNENMFLNDQSTAETVPGGICDARYQVIGTPQVTSVNPAVYMRATKLNDTVEHYTQGSRLAEQMRQNPQSAAPPRPQAPAPPPQQVPAQPQVQQPVVVQQPVQQPVQSPPAPPRSAPAPVQQPVVSQPQQAPPPATRPQAPVPPNTAPPSQSVTRACTNGETVQSNTIGVFEAINWDKHTAVVYGGVSGVAFTAGPNNNCWIGHDSAETARREACELGPRRKAEDPATFSAVTYTPAQPGMCGGGVPVQTPTQPGAQQVNAQNVSQTYAASFESSQALAASPLPPAVSTQPPAVDQTANREAVMKSPLGAFVSKPAGPTGNAPRIVYGQVAPAGTLESQSTDCNQGMARVTRGTTLDAGVAAILRLTNVSDGTVQFFVLEHLNQALWVGVSPNPADDLVTMDAWTSPCGTSWGSQFANSCSQAMAITGKGLKVTLNEHELPQTGYCTGQ